MLRGNEEEHDVLLCNYFQYLGQLSWIVLGTSVPEGSQYNIINVSIWYILYMYIIITIDCHTSYYSKMENVNFFVIFFIGLAAYVLNLHLNLCCIPSFM